ncbi:HAD-IA family hydrolase [Candidatus Micrarchaeota archaeon]|nr:HAD-IA family hydrolase [Candidatus Micrarchaeota archaeon]
MKIIFDIDDTLFPSTEFAALARKNAINAIIRLGLDSNPGKLNSQLTGIIRKKGSNYPHHFDDLLRQYKVKQPARYIAAAIAAYHDTKASIAPFPDVPLTLLQLKKNGHSIYAATNGTSIKQWDKLIRLGLALYFDDVFISEDLGVEKSPAFYRKIMKLLKTQPSGCIVVGDREDKDILPAKKAGILTVRVKKGKYAKKKSAANYQLNEIGELLQVVKNL